VGIKTHFRIQTQNKEGDILKREFGLLERMLRNLNKSIETVQESLSLELKDQYILRGFQSASELYRLSDCHLSTGTYAQKIPLSASDIFIGTMARRKFIKSYLTPNTNA
jgi:hypothetical protein